MKISFVSISWQAHTREKASCLGISVYKLLFVLSFSMKSIILTASEVSHKQLSGNNNIFKQYSKRCPLKGNASATLLHITMSSLLWFYEPVCLLLSFICPCFAVTIAHKEKFPTQLLFYLKASLLWIIVNDLASWRYAWWSILRLIFTAKQDFARWSLNSKTAFGNSRKNSADYLENCGFINDHSLLAGN